MDFLTRAMGASLVSGYLMQPRPSWISEREVSELVDRLKRYQNFSSSECKMVVTPYRVCPLGAHIDHQGGNVTAISISSGVLLCFTPSNNSQITLLSQQFPEVINIQVDCPMDPNRQKGNNWGDYARGALYALQQNGFEINEGFIGVVDGGNGFNGNGLSSSAALSISLLMAFESINHLTIPNSTKVKMGRMIENEFLGLKSGILDQSAVLLSSQNCLLSLDCENQTHELIPAPWKDSNSPFKILLAFSGLQEALIGGGGYNKRVEECRRAAETLLKKVSRNSEDCILCKVSFSEFEEHKSCLEEDERKRAEHFFSETQRVQNGIEAWKAGDLEKFGSLMAESGHSSIYNYECGSEPLIDLFKILLSAPGVYGARFSGAGFRGCCLALVSIEKVEEASIFIQEQYKLAQPQLVMHLENRDLPIVRVLDSTDGATVYSLN